MGTWSNQGFIAQPLSYYKSAIQDVFVEAFGSDFDLNDNLPQGVLIQRLAELFYGMDMDGIEAFSRLNLNTMGGLFLDVVGNLRGIPRVLGAPQTGLVAVTCNPQNFVSFTVPAGTVLTVSETGDQFVTTRLTTFTSNTGTLEVEYSSDGNSTAIVGNTMTTTLFPQIKNLEIISLFDGTEDESDISYRSRLKTEYPAAVGTIEYVDNLLRALPTVKAVGCLYNDTSSTVGGIPAYCTEWMVAPTAEAAETILDNSINVVQTVGDSLSDLEADITTFEAYVSPTGYTQYTFTYDGADWKDSDSNTVTLSDYGISYTGTPVADDAIEVSYFVGAFKISVGEVIVDNKVPGAPTHGNTSVTVTDIFGSNKTVNFTVATEVPIEIEITVATPEATGIFDLGGISEIKEKVAEYVNGLEIGNDVSYSRCMAPFAADTGFDIISFRMKAKSSGAWTTNGNLIINAREYASLQPEDITVGI